MYRKSLAQLSDDLVQKRVSSLEMTKYFLERAFRLNETFNAYITITEEQALADAKVADERLAKGESTPLLGIPIAQKDIFCTQGIKTTCGSKMLDNFISPYDATLIQRFKQSGAILLGKTNMDEFAMGSSNENSYYGSVKNPWAQDTVPGGSSGGSAAAVAARIAPGSTGTDTGGSIRQPAAFCNCTGLKPTYGRVSRYGMIAFASSLDQGGPIAQSAQDCAHMLQVMAGFDPKDSTSVDTPVDNYLETLESSLKGKTAGLPKEFFEQGLSSDVEKAIQETIKTFEGLGVTFKEISLPHSKYSGPTYYIVAPAECSSNLSRFDGVRYGHRCENPLDLEDLYKRSRSEGFGEEVKRRIMIGTYALSSGYYDAYYLRAQKVRQLISEDFNQAFEHVDFLLGPTTPTPSFKIGEKTDDPISMYLSDVYTIAVSLAGLPALSLPAGFVDNRPIGAQLISKHFNEGLLLNIAHQYQQATDWHTRYPKDIA